MNFILIGECRSGAWPVAGLLSTQSKVVCHDRSVNHPDVWERTVSHYTYFGKRDKRRPYGISKDGHTRFPHPRLHSYKKEHWIELDPVLPHYMEHTLFPNPVYHETHVGVHLTFNTIEQTQLYEAISTWARNGQIAVLLVDRNPFDCYVSYQAALQSGIWEGHTKRPLIPISIDPESCSEFVNRSLATRDRVVRSVQGIASSYFPIPYRLLLDLETLKIKLANSLQLEPDEFGVIPSTVLHPYRIKERVRDFDLLKKKVSSTTRSMMDLSESDDEAYFSKKS